MIPPLERNMVHMVNPIPPIMIALGMSPAACKQYRSCLVNDDPTKTTCEKCKKTKAWRDAMRRNEGE